MKNFRFLIVIAAMISSHALMVGQVYRTDEPLAHTYSIVAYDSVSGEMGVAVQSHWFQVGPLVAWGEAGVGVVATQSFVNPALGQDGIAMMKRGISASESLRLLIEADDGKDVRQVAMLDANGNCAAYTGEKCIQAAGHIEGKHYCVQANLMGNAEVWPAMAEAFESTSGPLSERMIAALNAAEDMGGDIRGKQSVALLVVSAKNTNQPWVDRVVDLRIDDHPEPLAELDRLYKIHRAYKFMNEGDLAIEHGELEKAMDAYGQAMKLNPTNEEMKYWYAVSLANADQFEAAKKLFKEVYAINPEWKVLTPRLIPNGLLNISNEQLMELLD